MYFHFSPIDQDKQTQTDPSTTSFCQSKSCGSHPFALYLQSYLLKNTKKKVKIYNGNCFKSNIFLKLCQVPTFRCSAMGYTVPLHSF